MKFRFVSSFFALVSLIFQGYGQAIRQETLFDGNWKFYLGDSAGAQKPSFDDKSWRDIDLPHDWSIEPLPDQKPGAVVGPFSKSSVGATATGYTLGGTAWYRKRFTLTNSEEYDNVIISFDGVYMNSEVWINGMLVGAHPYGYTAFYYDITQFVNRSGKANLIAIKVKNEGKNSRWYSGSGIYRHVWLIRKKAINITQNGVCITIETIAEDKAQIKIRAGLDKNTEKNPKAKLLIRIIGPDGKVAQTAETAAKPISSSGDSFVQTIAIAKPQLWSVEKPNLYTAEIEVIADNRPTDKTFTTFGIRVIHFDTHTGFTINGKRVLLKGGCMHNDNGLLGSATIDRAEERRVQLMKAYGFNAVRTSHNPPSKQFLDACDRNGILVIDEAFDMWERPKNPEDYHLYFKEWWAKDLESMVYRDRNHPSVIMWSIGNELNERADSTGYVITKKLADMIKELDPTRAVTEAICSFWDHPGQQWSTTGPAYASLDVGGYNYMWKQYEKDHLEFPERVMVGTESFPVEAYDNWKQVQDHPWVIGDFVWTAMDYLGETGLGSTSLTNGPRVGLKPWPWFNAFCGDIDLCGFKKPQMLYKDVVWNNSKLEMAVHRPVPEGRKETTTYWGWPDELQSWSWKGNEGKIMDVRVFSRYPVVRLELNGKLIAEQPAGDSSKLIANFKVPYQPGVLRAVALNNGKVMASTELTTPGTPAKIRLIADRNKITNDRNDLSYVKIEVTDAEGNLIPDAAIPVTLTISGMGEIAGSGNACPSDMESFNNKVCKTYHGQALAILRPLKGKKSGMIKLHATAEGLVAGAVRVIVWKL